MSIAGFLIIPVTAFAEGPLNEPKEEPEVIEEVIEQDERGLTEEQYERIRDLLKNVDSNTHNTKSELNTLNSYIQELKKSSVEFQSAERWEKLDELIDTYLSSNELILKYMYPELFEDEAELNSIMDDELIEAEALEDEPKTLDDLYNQLDKLISILNIVYVDSLFIPSLPSGVSDYALIRFKCPSGYDWLPSLNLSSSDYCYCLLNFHSARDVIDFKFSSNNVNNFQFNSSIYYRTTIDFYYSSDLVSWVTSDEFPSIECSRNINYRYSPNVEGNSIVYVTLGNYIVGVDPFVIPEEEKEIVYTDLDLFLASDMKVNRYEYELLNTIKNLEYMVVMIIGFFMIIIFYKGKGRMSNG